MRDADTLTGTFGVAGSLAPIAPTAPAVPAWAVVSPWDDDREANRLDAAWERNRSALRSV